MVNLEDELMPSQDRVRPYPFEYAKYMGSRSSALIGWGRSKSSDRSRSASRLPNGHRMRNSWCSLQVRSPALYSVM